jgi:hypothetical protein
MLRRAIRSVLRQTFRDFRICVYDNASNDETAAVVEEFQRKESRVEYFCRPTNIGAFANFMDGANRVETHFFSFLADDDLILPNFLETALSGFRGHPEAALSILPTLIMSPRGLILDATNLQWPAGLLLPPTGMLSTLQFGNPGLQAMLIRKAVWDEFGGFDEATDPAGEFDFDLRVMARLPIFVSKMPGGIQVMHRGTSTAAGGLDWVWPCFRHIINKVSQNPDLPPETRQRAVEQLTRWMTRGLVTRGVARSISSGRWEDAEKAADLFAQECQQSRAARTIRWTTTICRKLPSSRFVVSALLALRTSQKFMRNLKIQWRYRAHSRFLRASTVTACGTDLAPAARSVCEDCHDDRRPLRSARKTFS